MEEGINIVSLSNQEQAEIDGIQQEIITEPIDSDETVITVYQVNGSDITESRELPLDNIADLSALAAAAKFVPTLQETLPQKNQQILMLVIIWLIQQSPVKI